MIITAVFAFTSIFVLVDLIAAIPTFLAMTGDSSRAQRRHMAVRAANGGATDFLPKPVSDASIRSNIAEGRKAGVAGTPFFLLARTEPNSSKVRVLGSLMGAQPFAAFKAQIDSLLAEPAQAAAVHPSR